MSLVVIEEKKDLGHTVIIEGDGYAMVNGRLVIDRGPGYSALSSLLVDIKAMMVANSKSNQVPAKPAATGFKNGLLAFPAEILNDINQMIYDAQSPGFIMSWLINTYKGQLSIPDPKAFGEYIQWVKKQQPKAEPRHAAELQPYIKLKIKVHKSLDKGLLTKNWRNNDMPTVGVAILLAEAVEDAGKTTLTGSGAAGIMKKFGAKPNKDRGPKGITLYNPKVVAEVAKKYKEGWAITSAKRKAEATAKFAKKKGEASVASVASPQ